MSKQELQIVHAFSAIDVPENIIRNSNIKELIHGMTADQDAVTSDAQRLERLRQEKNQSNAISNWWNDRNDKIQDAQLDLNGSIGRLTQKSSQLLVVNTAISKVLSDQQGILHKQQILLKEQADELKEQNRKIIEQQTLLEQQQLDINAANQGLLEAKGLTQEQAQQLIGCVKLVREAEARIDSAGQTLKHSLEQRLQATVEHCLDQLDSARAQQTEQAKALEQQLRSALEQQTRQLHTEMTQRAAEHARLQSETGQALLAQEQAIQAQVIEQQTATRALREQLDARLDETASKTATALEQNAQALDARLQEAAQRQAAINQEQAHSVTALGSTLDQQIQALHTRLDSTGSALEQLQAEQQRSRNRTRAALALVSLLALASLGWQLARQLALI